MTKAEAIFHHRKMYHWIADETRKQKRKATQKEYFKQNDIPRKDKPFQDCYACCYDEQHGGFCEFCPIDWGDGMGCIDGGSPYREWLNCDKNDWERAAELADKIAELPEKIFADKEGSN